MYINGEWVDAKSGKTRDIINPANGEVIAKSAEGASEDAKAAIEVARKTFDSGVWSDLSAGERASYLYKIADKLEEKIDELKVLETLDNGKPHRETEFDISDAADCFRYYAGLTTKPHGLTYDVPESVQAMTIREPIGVCGLITPWNYPLLMGVWKIAPALAAGNTIVYKPSEVTPVTAVNLFEIIEEVGIPKGVANLVLGPGVTAGAEISENHDVDKVSFTGGTKTGRSIMRAAAGNIKKFSLELGGKSPNVVFADSDFETAVDCTLFGIFTNAGQVCTAGSRLIIEESIHDKFIDRLVERAKKIRVGPGDNPNTEMGPLVSKEHMEKVLNYIRIGKEEDGAHLACGGNRLTEKNLGKGNFIEPTIFINTTPNMRIVQEEIFGPVLVVQKFNSEQEAIELANNTVYGLGAAVFANDGAKAMRVTKKIRAGICWVNTYHLTFNEAPWGGYKQSGIGRGLGTYGFEEFTEVKQININLQVEPVGWFEN